MSWWDYRYQIAGLSNRTTLVDNNTWNNTHIATMDRAMSTNEADYYEIMKKHDVSYILIILGRLLGYSSGDGINKFLWIIRIAQGICPDKIRESDLSTASGEHQASTAMKELLSYRMNYYRFNETFGGRQSYDRVRNQPLPSKGPELSVLDKAITSEIELLEFIRSRITIHLIEIVVMLWHLRLVVKESSDRRKHSAAAC